MSRLVASLVLAEATLLVVAWLAAGTTAVVVLMPAYLMLTAGFVLVLELEYDAGIRLWIRRRRTPSAPIR